MSYSFHRCFTKDATGKDLTNVMNELLKDYDKTVRPNYGGNNIFPYILGLCS